jgi:superfamily II DNA or RNA helicase
LDPIVGGAPILRRLPRGSATIGSPNQDRDDCRLISGACGAGIEASLAGTLASIQSCMRTYSFSDIQTAIPSGTLSRGYGYQRQGRVQGLRFLEDGEVLTGRVRGSQPRPYEQQIQIVADGDHVEILGSCTCPVGFNCKHVAAVLLAGMANPEGRKLARPDGLDPILAHWLHELGEAFAPAPTNDYPPEIRQRLIYVLQLDGKGRSRPSLSLVLFSVRLLKDGRLSASPTRYKAENVMNAQPATFLRPNDRDILHRLCRDRGAGFVGGYIHSLHGEAGRSLLESILATGRCHWLRIGGPNLSAGPARRGEPSWTSGDDGTQKLIYRVDGGAADAILPVVPPHYVDLTSGLVGSIESGLPDRVAAALVMAPPIPPGQVSTLHVEIERRLPGRALPLPHELERTERTDVEPIRCLRLFVAVLDHLSSRYWGRRDSDHVPLARLSFDYDGAMVRATDPRPQLTRAAEQRLITMVRSRSAERRAMERLERLGFEPVEELGLYHVGEQHRGDLVMLAPDADDDVLDPESAWLDFSFRHLPELRAEGWRIEFSDDYPYRVAEADDDWLAEVREGSGIDWFGLELGVTVDGERVSLLPILSNILAALPTAAALADLTALADAEVLFAPLPDGRILPLPIERVRPLLTALFELFRVGAITADGTVSLAKVQAAELADLEVATSAAGLRWLGGEQLRELGRKLREFTGIEPALPPPGFHGKLRPYQSAGLSWLQFLRDFGFGGILADDMGLGKTVQALAHLMVEKTSGRMDRPSLVVAPTSLMANWRLEAERFAPELAVLTLHGTDRKQRFAEIGAHDLVLTTYPLLRHDREALLAEEFHLVILDEAQAIKNPGAGVTKIVHHLRARHRLCLTGTPLENHLGELWSLCHFLMPGLLGDARQFRSAFRTPIEKHGDPACAAFLARRVRPFLLRRTKAEVERDLPEKTEIVENIELLGAQRDLYESLRLAMHERVRREIAKKGAARSHIVILDALLKLRQVCCDPRLVKLEAARQVTQSAKLERLLDMLPEMIEEGRRILLFSQFTSMLALIEPELEKLALPYLKLTGRTKDRGSVVERFQAGEVPLFMISLKAGGSGLNLTAADTVIHYDPWWNPAVEDQATDRAHRIGQDKAVFVYKLRTLGTVEEKILELQATKRELAEGLFTPGSKAATAISEADLASLFASTDA